MGVYLFYTAAFLRFSASSTWTIPVDAVSVHGCGGAWGLLAIGLFVHDFSDQDGPDDQDEQCSRCGLFRGGSAYLLAIQALTCVTIALWSAVTTYILLVIVNRLVPIRLSLEHEVLGADLVEHGIVHPDIDYAQLLRRNGLEPSKLLPPHTAERLDREAWDLRLCRSYLAERLGGRGVQRQEPNSFWSLLRRRQMKQIHP
ncbi:hypothetical protein MTO96_008327 [Rhipicephalus appendiculatus]